MNLFNLPDLGEGLPDAEIHEWFVKEGDVLLGLDGFETLGPVNLNYILKQDRIQKATSMKCQIYRKGGNPLEGTLLLSH